MMMMLASREERSHEMTSIHVSTWREASEPIQWQMAELVLRAMVGRSGRARW